MSAAAMPWDSPFFWAKLYMLTACVVVSLWVLERVLGAPKPIRETVRHVGLFFINRLEAAIPQRRRNDRQNNSAQR